MKRLSTPIGSSTWEGVGLAAFATPYDIVIPSGGLAGAIAITSGEGAGHCQPGAAPPYEADLVTDASLSALPAMASLADPTADTFGHFITDLGTQDAATINHDFNEFCHRWRQPTPAVHQIPLPWIWTRPVRRNSFWPIFQIPPHIRAGSGISDASPDFSEIVTPQINPNSAAVGSGGLPAPQPASWILASTMGELPGDPTLGATSPGAVVGGSLVGTFAAPAAGTIEASGTGSSQIVTYSGSGFVFDNTFGTGVTATFQTEIVAAENYLQSLFGNAVTVNTTFS